MNAGDVAVAVLLAIGVGSALMGSLGILATRNPYDHRHSASSRATDSTSRPSTRSCPAAATTTTAPEGTRGSGRTTSTG